jgi:uncharacterized protein YbjQ (UPF0145 family)
MILTTAPAIEGKKIVAHYGIVSSETILGANIFKDFLAGIRDIVGGRSGAYEKSLREAKQLALRELSEEAAALGANAVIAVDLDYETINSGGGTSLLMVAVSGTAVRYEAL